MEVAEGREVWLLGDERIGAVGPTAPAGWKEPMPDSPAGYDDVHPAAYDAGARLELMDQRGVWAEVLYPNVGGFGAPEVLVHRRRRAEVRVRAGLQRLLVRVVRRR